MSYSGSDNTDSMNDGLHIRSDLFPAFRKSAAMGGTVVTEQPAARTYMPSAASAPRFARDGTDGAAGEGGMPEAAPAASERRERPSEADREAEKLLSGDIDEPEDTAPSEEEYVPALFGGVSLEKLRDREALEALEAEAEEPDREPTLLEFLSQPVDRGEPLPVPSLFEGIGNEYYSSGYILKLAEEQEAEERARQEAAEAAERQAQGLQPEPEPEPEPLEPPPAPEELFGMISDILQQQQDDWQEHQRLIREGRNKKADPYNTAFNNREVLINYDNIGELPMRGGYGFAQVTEEEQAAYDRRAGRTPRVIGEPEPQLKFNRRRRSERRRMPQHG